MADNVVVSKNTLEGFNIAASNDPTQRRPSYNSVWTRRPSADVDQQLNFPSEQQQQQRQQQQQQQRPPAPVIDVNQQMYSQYEEQPQPVLNKRSRFLKSLNRTLSGKSNSLSWSNIRHKLPHRLSSDVGRPQVHDNLEQRRSENTGEDYGPEEEYYTYEKPYKQKGLSAKIDRLVYRFPVLGKVYKQPPNSPYRTGAIQQCQYPQAMIPGNSNQFERELTADELTLNQRYTDKAHMKVINLQAKDLTQPVDVCIHHETNKIYSCDIGRSIVEIFDSNGTLLHVIDDPTTLKFQPTAIVVAFDGTIIIASHFNHCLHMYSANDSQNYKYKQFKLGTPGDQIHQFYHPAGIAIDHRDGFLYVCDRGNYRIQVIRPEGICERVIELVLNDKQKHPLDATRIAVQTNLDQLVCILGNGDAICFIPKLANGRYYVEPLYILDENGLGLDGASGLAVDSHDRIFISDTNHHRIVICTPEGGYITSIGTEGDGLGQLKRPCGIDITNHGTLVVSDPGNKRLQLFGSTTIEGNNPSNHQEPTELNIFTNL